MAEDNNNNKTSRNNLTKDGDNNMSELETKKPKTRYKKPILKRKEIGNLVGAYATANLGADVSDDSDRISVTILSTIDDRWAGLSTTIPVWGPQTSARYITSVLSDPDNRDAVADFFARRKLAGVVRALLPGLAKSSRTFRPNEKLVEKRELHAVLIKDYNSAVSGVIMELTLPILIGLGVVADNIKNAQHIRYPFRDVSIESIRSDIAVSQVLRAVAKAKVSGDIDPNARMTVDVFATALAEAMRPVGLALYEYQELSHLIDDMVSGVRAHLDPTLSGGELTGDVPSSWRNNPVVAELATNTVFVNAALALPPRSNISLVSEGWKLEKSSKEVLAAIKSSERYAWISKQEYLRSYGLTKVRDVKDRIKASVLYRSAKVEPTSQAVFAIDDSILEGAYSIHATKDRIADAIQVAYGNADFQLSESAVMLKELLLDGIEAGWTGNKQLYTVDLLDKGTDIVTIACMLSTNLEVEATGKGVEINKPDPEDDSTWTPKWWFTVPTKDQDLDIMSGTHLRNRVYTCDPVEVMLAADEFNATENMMVKPQLLGPAAFGSTVVDFNPNILKSVSTRYAFDVVINGVSLRGSFKPSSFASMRSRDMTSLVVPHFNVSVIESYASAYQMADSVLSSMEVEKVFDPNDDESEAVTNWLTDSLPSSEFFSHMRRRVARSLLDTAQKLSPGFRQEVHDTIVSKTVAQSGISADDALILRAKLSQRTFAAACDMIALDFFLATQGVTIEIWRELMADPEMVKVWMELGSDRTQSVL
jgi:hypothetical protein